MLVGDLPGIQFVVFEKQRVLGMSGITTALSNQAPFDVATNANIAARQFVAGMIPARRKVGFPRAKRKNP